MSIEDLLASLEPFRELTRDDIARLARATVPRSYQSGQAIVREGELGVSFFVVSEGKVEVVGGLGSGHEVVFATLVAGGYFGEMALFDNQVLTASVRAVEDSECLVLTKWDYLAATSPPQ
jgi:CRP-like cAMP-binding protein